VTNAILPFQVIEQIDEPRAEVEHAPDLFELDRHTGRQQSGWTNKLIWGDNKLVLSSLKNGPLRREIEKAGGLKLVYIDPPFDVGADFSVDIEIGDDTLTKEPSVIEDIAYRDTWGKGVDSFISMLFERLFLLHDLIAHDGSIFVHCDWRMNSLIRLCLDEIFGKNNFSNSIVWSYSGWNKKLKRSFEKRHDNIIFYTKSDKSYFESYFQPWASKEEYVKARKQKIRIDDDGREYVNSDAGKGERIKRYLDDAIKDGVVIDDVWPLDKINNSAHESLDYPTQKPEILLERIIAAACPSNGLVADFFCGSGTTLAVAEKLGRKWIGCDLGRFAIHTSRKRLIGVQRELKKEHKPYRSFEILNLGKYERQYFVGIDPTLPEKQRQILSAQKEEHYTTLILQAYKAERVFQSPPFQGRKGNALVLVGAVDAPVTSGQCKLAIDAARKLGVTQVHLLGFEFEMGLTPRIQDEARDKGVNLALRHIPKEVFDKRAVEKNQISFYDVAYAEVKTERTGLDVKVQLERFGVAYVQDDTIKLADDLKPGASKVTIDKGQVVKISKDKNKIVTTEILTKQWTDWIDYWAVDFDYENRKEIVTVTAPDADGRLIDRPQWTGGYIFENEWQSYRTKKDRSLELVSASHTYPKKGKYKIAIKIIDIFGNDTTKVVEVVV
jgi:DNA modification methylase